MSLSLGVLVWKMGLIPRTIPRMPLKNGRIRWPPLLLWHQNYFELKTVKKKNQVQKRHSDTSLLSQPLTTFLLKAGENFSQEVKAKRTLCRQILFAQGCCHLHVSHFAVTATNTQDKSTYEAERFISAHSFRGVRVSWSVASGPVGRQSNHDESTWERKSLISRWPCPKT
jgi:hypothetical protein